jgi:hypothetical protein
LQSFLDSLDFKNLTNMANELLEFEDDDEGPNTPSNKKDSGSGNTKSIAGLDVNLYHTPAVAGSAQ